MKWHSVNNKLPARFQCVLLSDGAETTIGHFGEVDFVPIQTGLFALGPVTHWASIPKPPADTPAQERPCPLAELPELEAAFPKIERVLHEIHPKAKPLDFNDRDALAKLHRIDGYSQREILEVLRWLFRSDHTDALFWRAQVFALAPLRKAKDGATKFARIYAAWKRADAEAKRIAAVADRIQQQTENRIRESLGLAKVS